jgi:Domain of unknown function (DUF1877)
MACRGIFYAITHSEAEHLLRLVGNDDALIAGVHDLHSSARERAGFQCPVDKAWDAMHRCLGDGTLEFIGEGWTPESLCVLGGKNLYDGSDYIVCYVAAGTVPSVAQAIDPITKEWFRSRYFAAVPQEFDVAWHKQDFEYTWSYFGVTRELYQRAAKAGRAIVFETDQ